MAGEGAGSGGAPHILEGVEDNNNNSAPPVATVTIHVEATAGD